MQKDSAFFEDIAKLTSSAAGALMDVRRELESMVSEKVARVLSAHAFVARDEFEVVRAMAQKAREENEALRAELAALKQKTD
jgi:BMFP domain-containing protein YqiC